jgi:hypothetical protein
MAVIIAVVLLITAAAVVVDLAKLGSLEQRLLGAATVEQEHLTTVALMLVVVAAGHLETALHQQEDLEAAGMVEKEIHQQHQEQREVLILAAGAVLEEDPRLLAAQTQTVLMVVQVS